ncbi:protein of unknown function [Nitrospina watsonii]|uniref:Uncharacterized protein n=1 Tax=Nitrospina watsonii TaxID=1323948 RepID=A0ABM9HEU9_9BACT|nr:protein of unknown function [Nitrospina watsonii]
MRIRLVCLLDSSIAEAKPNPVSFNADIMLPVKIRPLCLLTFNIESVPPDAQPPAQN